MSFFKECETFSGIQTVFFKNVKSFRGSQMSLFLKMWDFLGEPNCIFLKEGVAFSGALTVIFKNEECKTFSRAPTVFLKNVKDFRELQLSFFKECGTFSEAPNCFS